MMTRQERAKQFLPFDAMKGLQEALRDREEKLSRVGRRELSEEDMQDLSLEVMRLHNGDLIRVLYYSSFHEIEKKGMLEKVDMTGRYIILAGERIFLDDIYKIELIM